MQTKFPIGTVVKYKTSYGEDGFKYGIVQKGPDWAEAYQVFCYWVENRNLVKTEIVNRLTWCSLDEVMLADEPAEQPEVQKQDKFEYLCVPQKGVEFPIENWLNQYGEVGWEMICIDYGKVIFKRKVQE